MQVWETKEGYRTFVNCGDPERVPAHDRNQLNKIAFGYYGKDVHRTLGYEVDYATGVLLTPSDHLLL